MSFPLNRLSHGASHACLMNAMKTCARQRGHPCDSALPPALERVASVGLRQLVYFVFSILHRALVFVRFQQFVRKKKGKGMLAVVFACWPFLVFHSGCFYDPTQCLAFLLLHTDASGNERRSAADASFAKFKCWFHRVGGAQVAVESKV